MTIVNVPKAGGSQLATESLNSLVIETGNTYLVTEQSVTDVVFTNKTKHVIS